MLDWQEKTEETHGYLQKSGAWLGVLTPNFVELLAGVHTLHCLLLTSTQLLGVNIN